MTRYHPAGPDVAAGDLARMRFVAELRSQLNGRLAQGNRAIYAQRLGRDDDEDLRGEAAAERREELRQAMEREPYYQTWSSMLRSSQDLMWRLVDQAVSADLPAMASRLEARANTRGSLELDDTVEPPPYLLKSDTHRMPGSYFRETGTNDVRAGALYDLGSAMYQFGRGNQGGRLLNDSRGRTTVAHLKRFYPGLAPRRVLDLGCAAGQNTLPLCDAFPDARVEAIDIGAPMLRYAHLRAEGLEKVVHFSQRNAEATGFADGAFDLVISQILLHETSPQAASDIIRESWRLLAPGGVAVHLEVPIRFDRLGVFDQFMRSWEQYYNGESNTVGVASADFAGEMRQAGFADVRAGFQPMATAGSDLAAELHDDPPPGVRCHYIVSGRRA